ncbi:uncharacterized protein LOC129757935 [Uranotaenia lowii]|uniref:uncharacterized protein LOC129757935 n=1 Tax=Uranotaenia lowii TaxID=190385 RepID=UPI002479958E|nr:uncharacterized protein LOC129757935 [Uranotaenia lowii]
MALTIPVMAILTAATCGNSLRFPNPQNTAVIQYSSSLVAILDRYYISNHSATRISLADNEEGISLPKSEVLNQVMGSMSQDIAFAFNTRNSRPRRPYYYNMFFVNNYAELRIILDQLSPMRYEYSGQYLVVICSHGIVERSVLLQIFDDLWNFQILNVVVAVSDLDAPGEQQEIILYSYFPFREDYCENTEPIVLRRWFASSVFDYSVDLFPKKLVDFNGCRLMVATFHYPPYIIVSDDPITGKKSLSGIEGNMLDMIARKLNFTMEVIQLKGEVKWGAIKNQTAVSGAVKLVADGVANMTVGAFSMHGDRIAVLKQSSSYYTVKLIFTVPPGRSYTAFEKLFRPFAFLTWVVLSAYLIIGVSIIFIMRYVSRSARSFVYGYGIQMPTLNVFNVLFGGAMTRTPARNFARTLLFLWMYYCLIIRSLYQGSLFEYLQQQKNFSHLNTLQKIEAAKLTYLLANASKTSVAAMPFILKRYKTIQDDSASFYEAFRNQSQHRENVAILTTNEHALYFNEKNYLQGIVYIADDVILRQPICLYFAKKSCLPAQINSEIGQIVTAGIFDAWLNQYVGHSFHKVRVSKHHAPIVMTVEHLQGCFQMLFFMLMVAVSVFAVELLASRSHRVRAAVDFVVNSEI